MTITHIEPDGRAIILAPSPALDLALAKASEGIPLTDDQRVLLAEHFAACSGEEPSARDWQLLCDAVITAVIPAVEKARRWAEYAQAFGDAEKCGWSDGIRDLADAFGWDGLLDSLADHCWARVEETRRALFEVGA